MRTKSPGTNAAVLAIGLLVSTSTADPPDGWELVQIKENATGLFSIFPEMNETGQIVFDTRTISSPATFQIDYYDNGRLRRLTDNPPGGKNGPPDINDDGLMLWGAGSPFFEIPRILKYDHGEIELLTPTWLNASSPVFVSENKVAFKSRFGDSHYEVFLWDEGTIVQITDNGLANQSVRSNNLGDLVWTRYDFFVSPWQSDIMLLRGGEILEIPHPPDAFETPQGPDINDAGKVVWREYIEGPELHHIVEWTGGDTSSPFTPGGLPRINNHGDMYFNRWDFNDNTYHAVLCRDGSFYQLTDGQTNVGQGAMNDRGEVAFPFGPSTTGIARDMYLLWEIRDPGDFNNNDVVDLLDFGSFANCYTGPDPEGFVLGPCRNVCDFDQDGDIDLQDYDAFLAVYAGPPSGDCNLNGVTDFLDILFDSSADEDDSGVPDECEADCNENGIPDIVDVIQGTSQDCNDNGVPDECTDIEGDCNENGIPDGCDVTAGSSQDCNDNNIPDECDGDCNQNGTFDECDIAAGTSLECNCNGIPDECDIAEGRSNDGNGNNVPDECESAVRLYVDADPADGSWPTAYADLQDALDIAACDDTQVTEIWIAAGTYTPSKRFDPIDPRTAMFQLPFGLSMYGGFVGGETALDQRDVLANQTILSGDLNGNDGAHFQNNQENCYLVINTSFSDDSSTLDGFTITGANANDQINMVFLNGGGLYNAGGGIRVSHCTFTSNWTQFDGGALFNGGGNPVVSDCAFYGNHAQNGGAIKNGSGGTLTATNCVFSGNTADLQGGAVHNGTFSAELVNCTFTANAAGESGGAVFAQPGTTVSVVNAIVWNSGSDPMVGPVTATYSDVQGGFDGDGNIDADPAFVNADGPDDIAGTDDDDVRLRADSPAIDAGDPTFVPPPGATDFDGHARVLCGRVDIGAYEFGIGDVDCDRDVDLFDFAEWGGCVTGPIAGPLNPGCEAFDFNGDADVDFADFRPFQIALDCAP